MIPEPQNGNVFPKDDISPDDKDIEWGKQFAKAAWNYWSFYVPKTCFYSAGDKYEMQRLYALGMQDVDKYKRWMGVDAQTQETWINIDWSVSPVAGTIRDIAISRMMQQEYDIMATPIDPLAKDELDQKYAKLKAQIAVKQAAEAQNTNIADHPMIQIAPGEPLDEEELVMRLEFGEQFNRSKDAEMAIKLGLYENGESILRHGIFEDLFDYGVAGYYEWLGEDDKPKVRKVNPEAVIANYCRWSDFRDLRYAGELLDIDTVDLAEVTNPDGSLVFSDKDLDQMATDIAGHYFNQQLTGRTANFFKSYDRTKVKVLHLRWFSWNDYVFNDRTSSAGNPIFAPAPDYRKNSKSGRYTSKRFKVVYEIKWIVGTNWAYDFKLANDMVRSNDPKKKAETNLGYRFIAWNFYEMRAKGMMERIIPILDQYQMNVYRIQNIKNRMIPNAFWIDLDGLEATALTKGGKKMTPLDLIDMFFATGVLVGRSKDVMGDNVNYKPIIPIQNSIADEIGMIMQDMFGQIQQMKQMVGLNDVTDASTPPTKLLTPGYENANAGTNNALYRMQVAERSLLQKMGEDILARTQQGLKRGGIEGYAPALNSNALQFLRLDPKIGNRVFGIMLEERPDQDQRMWLVQQMQADIANGLLDMSDVITIMNTYNLKQAQMMFAYKIKKNKQAQQQAIQMNQQQTIQGQQQSAMQTAQMQANMQTQAEQAKMDQIKAQGDIEMQVASMKTGGTMHSAEMAREAKITVAALQQSSKEEKL